ncbi:MAG: acyl-CoA dehydrogenase family protein [Casimicrobiaceae bacterium]
MPPPSPTRALSMLSAGNIGAGEALRALVDDAWDVLPLPGGGDTLGRWRRLAVVASTDLSLAKLFEGHTDALAIIAELAPSMRAPGTWATWAAEPPGGRVEISGSLQESARLCGTKRWCSGALDVDHALVTCWRGDHGPFLAAVDLAQPGVRVRREGWHAVGMAATASFPVEFDNARARLVGGEGAYLARRGFWHGGAGIAACWYGGAFAIAEAARADARATPDPFRAARVGAIDVAMSQAAAMLREAAGWIDARPDADARDVALRVRASVEHTATRVLEHAGAVMGAAAYCLDARFARMAADLPVFLRQSHAERDLSALGENVATRGVAWAL